MSTEDEVTDTTLESLTQVIEVLRKLSSDSRIHVWRTVGHFFQFPVERERHPFAPIRTSENTGGELPAPHFSEDRAPTPKAFLLEKRPRTDVDRIACLAYYLQHYRGQSEFRTIDLSTLNTEGAQVKFSNAAQAVENATKAGLIVPTTKGAKQLSALGEVYVSMLPDQERARESLREHRPVRRPKRRKDPANE